MATREQMIEKALEVLATYEPIEEHVRVTLVEGIFDEVLPEVRSVAELEALPTGTVVLSAGRGIAYRADAGERGRRWWWPTGQGASWTSHQLALGAFSPLTVVWQPDEVQS